METSVNGINSINNSLEKTSKDKQPQQKSNAGMSFTPQPIGVVEPPKLSKTPIQDRLERVKQENAKVTLNIDAPKPKASLTIFKIVNFALVAMAAVFSIDALIKVGKKLSSISLPRLR